MSLETGETHYVTEAGEILAEDNTRRITRPGEPVDLVAGILASAAIPVLFEPVRLNGETYVDGGIRQVLPVEIAVRAGADRLFTIVNTPLPAPPSQNPYDHANLIAILQRAYTVLSHHELLRGNLLAGGLPAVPNTVILPTVYTLGVIEVNPGLMQIGWDYGYLRAGDVVSELSDNARTRAMRVTDGIIVLRSQVWHLEEAAGAGDMTRNALDRIRAHKWLIARLLDARARLGLPVPREASRWPLGWERHETGAALRGPWEDRSFEGYVPERVALREQGTDDLAVVAGGVISARPGEAAAIAGPVVTVPPGTLDALREAPAA